MEYDGIVAADHDYSHLVYGDYGLQPRKKSVAAADQSKNGHLPYGSNKPDGFMVTG